jgi:hypothetical protein
MTLSNRHLSFFIALAYVGGGTIMGAIYWTDFNSLEGIGGYLNNFFLLASFLMEGIMFTERNPFFWVLICQTVLFFISWGTVYLFISIVRSHKN